MKIKKISRSYLFMFVLNILIFLTYLINLNIIYNMNISLLNSKITGLIFISLIFIYLIVILFNIINRTKLPENIKLPTYFALDRKSVV